MNFPRFTTVAHGRLASTSLPGAHRIAGELTSEGPGGRPEPRVKTEIEGTVVTHRDGYDASLTFIDRDPDKDLAICLNSDHGEIYVHNGASRKRRHGVMFQVEPSEDGYKLNHGGKLPPDSELTLPGTEKIEVRSTQEGKTSKLEFRLFSAVGEQVYQFKNGLLTLDSAPGPAPAPPQPSGDAVEPLPDFSVPKKFSQMSPAGLGLAKNGKLRYPFKYEVEVSSLHNLYGQPHPAVGEYCAYAIPSGVLSAGTVGRIVAEAPHYSGGCIVEFLNGERQTCHRHGVGALTEAQAREVNDYYTQQGRPERVKVDWFNV